MPQALLAKLMGVSLQEVERRIKALLAHCDENNMPHPIIVLKDKSGRVLYRVNPAQKQVLVRTLLAN